VPQCYVIRKLPVLFIDICKSIKFYLLLNKLLNDKTLNRNGLTPKTRKICQDFSRDEVATRKRCNNPHKRTHTCDIVHGGLSDEDNMVLTLDISGNGTV
jgi:hypothetical protein